jgi:class 3 adenylate cyclase/predicted Ser/Thr protein kinase
MTDPDPRTEETITNRPAPPAAGGPPPDPTPPPQETAGLSGLDDLPPLPQNPPAPPPAGMPPLPAFVGRYRIDRLLGRGGMGMVYLAHDPQLDRPVALKVPFFGPDQPQALERFRREARAAGRLHHANICPVYDVGEDRGVFYLTMAFLEGQTLAELREHYRNQAWTAAVDLIHTLALALEEAHRHGIIHRDLKPSNIMITRRGEPIIMDFGLARCLESPSAIGPVSSPGVILGTPAYMAPEQASGDPGKITAACDIYSLGVILYELLTGRTPFQGSNYSILIKLACEEVLPPTQLRADLDPRLEPVLMQALARDLSRRYASMEAFAQGLAALLDRTLELIPRGADTARMTPLGATPDQSLTLKLDEAVSRIDEVLGLLRQWGWDQGVAKLEERGARGDSRTREVWRFFAQWMGGESAIHLQAIDLLSAVEQRRALVGWAFVGQSCATRKGHDYDRVMELLDEAARDGDPGDMVLRATIAHFKGSLLARRGRYEPALALLHEALDGFGRDHFCTGRVLDTMGMVYAFKDNFHAARVFYEQALECKKRFNDEDGVALTHGQLGRLYLDWGDLDRAEEHFQIDLGIARKGRDERSQAQMSNHLGQVALARADDSLAEGDRTQARRHWGKAAGYFDWCIEHTQPHNRRVLEAYARKDRALLCLAEGQLDRAEEHALRAEELFGTARYPGGMALIRRVLGCLRRAQGRYPEAEAYLRDALKHFDEHNERAEAARTQLELARTLQAAGEMRAFITEAFLDALHRAERCRRDYLVEQIEIELKAADEDAYNRHIYQRVRGRGIEEETTSLAYGSSESATVMFLNLAGFTPFSQGATPEEVLATLNQMLADLETVLEKHRAIVTAFLGGGFMALVRGDRHAPRGVSAALELLEVIASFNRPRGILGLRQLPARIGLSSGSVCLGNVGTYHKMDFTALGAPVTLAANLMRQATTTMPCITRETYELVRDQFDFAPDSPRRVELKNIGPREAWDVLRRKGTAS